MRLRSIWLVALAVLAATSGPRFASPCGEEPWAPPGFVLWTGPENLEAFAAGDLGIVLPSYARSYLVVAYRAMIGMPLTEAERNGALRVWTVRLGRGTWGGPGGLDDWLSVRSRVCPWQGVPGTTKTVIREDPEVEALRYLAFTSCYPDAFNTAADRLEELIAKYGPSAPETFEWLAAQDVVFKNCSSDELVLPPAYGGTAEQRADRKYQTAAAWFYANDFDMAEAAFRAIAGDPESRWRTLAPYLVVRCLVRRADFESQQRVGYLSQALVEIDRFLRDRATRAFHAAGSRMRGIVLRRLDPDRRTPELAELIAAGKRPDEFAENLWDLTQLLDLYQYEWGRKWNDSILRPDLIAWLRAFQSQSPSRLPEVVAKWQQTRNVPWLIAALSLAGGEDAVSSELMVAAAAVNRRSPAWPTVEYHRLRLLVEQAHLVEARRGLDALLGSATIGKSTSTGNLLRHLRARVSRDRSDFLESAVQTPLYRGRGRYSEMGQWVEESIPRLAETAIVETLLPLSEQRALVDEAGLDDATRERLAAAVWVRAILLRRLDIARQVTPRVQAIATRLRNPDGEADALCAFPAVATEREAYREAIFALLHMPGMVPFLGPRGRGAEDLYHGGGGENWWAGWQDSWPQVWDRIWEPWGRPTPIPAEGAYLSAALRARAEEERRQLAVLGSPLSVLGKEILSWARQVPSEPRIPKMLHDLIFAGRYTTGDEDSVDLLRRAFSLLHGRYKDTRWAADMPYWYEPPRVIDVQRGPGRKGL